MAKKNVKVTINDTVYEYPAGTTFEKIAQDNQKDYDAKIVLAVTYGRLRELHKKVNEDCTVSFNTVKDIQGVLQAFPREGRTYADCGRAYDLQPVHRRGTGHLGHQRGDLREPHAAFRIPCHGEVRAVHPHAQP